MLTPRDEGQRRWPIRLLAVGLIVALTLLFALFLQEGFRRVAVVPLIHAYLRVRFYFSLLPQSILWTIPALGMAMLLLAIYLRTVFTIPREERTTPHRKQETDPLRALAITIHRARRRPFHRRIVMRKLEKLAVRIIAQREGLSLPEARMRFESGGWCDNRAVCELFLHTREYDGLNGIRDFERALDEAISVLENSEQGV